MKTKLIRAGVKTMAVIGLGAGLLLIQPALAAGIRKAGTTVSSDDEDPAKKAKSKSRGFSSLNNSSVKIYPDIIRRMMHVVAKENQGREIDFFVFDMEGTLLHNYKMKPKDHIKIEGLAKGTYTYRVFSGDVETASGNFEIK